MRFSDVPYEECPGLEQAIENFREGNRCNWIDGKMEKKKKTKGLMRFVEK